MEQMNNYKGKKIGRLEVLEIDSNPTKTYGNKYLRWFCLCSCGNIVSRRSDTLTRALEKGCVASCGCYKRERCSGLTVVHFDRLKPYITFFQEALAPEVRTSLVLKSLSTLQKIKSVITVGHILDGSRLGLEEVSKDTT